MNDSEAVERLAAARASADEAREQERQRWAAYQTPEWREELRQRSLEIEQRKREARAAAGRAGARARWAGHKSRAATTLKVYPEDVAILHSLKGYGFACQADVLHRILELSAGLFWERRPDPFKPGESCAYPLDTLFRPPSSPEPHAGT